MSDYRKNKRTNKMNEYLKYGLIAAVIFVVGYILFVNLRRRRRIASVQQTVSETLYRQAQLDERMRAQAARESGVSGSGGGGRKQVSPGVVRSHMLEIAKNHRILLNEEADKIMEAVYKVFLEYGAHENVCLFAEMLEATLARSIAYRRNCDEAQNMAASLIEQLLTFIISLHPNHYEMKLKPLIERARGVLNAPTNTNWVPAITLS